jgi:hypothetical protein
LWAGLLSLRQANVTDESWKLFFEIGVLNLPVAHEQQAEFREM